jgi:phage-related protein
MRSLSRAVLKASAKTSTSSAWLLLLDFTIGGNTGRFVDNSVDVVFGGNTYSAASLSINTAPESADGTMTSWTIVVADLGHVLAPVIESYDGAVGAVVTLIIVNSKLLAENYAELTRTFVVKATSIDGDNISLQLSGSNLLVARCPRYRFRALHCNWHIGDPECGIAGTCNRTYAACVANSNQARFGGFLSLRSGVLRYV